MALPGALAFSADADTARAVLGAIATISVSVAGVSFSVIVVALVLASQQLSPRVLRSFQRQLVNQGVLAMLLGTAVFSLFTMRSIGSGSADPVPEFSVGVATVLAAAAMAMFVYFLGHAVRSLNASVLIQRIAADGDAALSAPYPAGAGEPAPAGVEWQPRGRRVEVRAPRAGYLACIDGEALVEAAAEMDVQVEQCRGVGDFVVTGGLLAAAHTGGEVDAGRLAAAFELQEERDIVSDVAFPIRQLADIALKGLSPGINDPSTAENAMDSITDTLVRFAKAARPAALRVDAAGVPRLLAIAPSLDDLVRLGFDQVRRDGASRPSFAVRLLELLRDLRDAAPAAATSDEVARQARLIAELSGAEAAHEEDAALVRRTYERLHTGR